MIGLPKKKKKKKKRYVKWEVAFKKWIHKIGKEDGRTESPLGENDKTISLAKRSGPAPQGGASKAAASAACSSGRQCGAMVLPKATTKPAPDALPRRKQYQPGSGQQQAIAD